MQDAEALSGAGQGDVEFGLAAPHERWAELAKRMQDTEHAGDDTTN